MDNKTKDTIFSILMLALGAYVVIEGINIFKKAAQPPYRITELSISPGFLPIIVGSGIILLSLILLVRTLVVNKVGFTGFGKIMSNFGISFVRAFKDPGVIKMIIGAAIMAVLTFILIDHVPFWICGTLYVIVTMFYLRATSWWKILLLSVLSMGAIYLLFQVAFKTILP